jgi:hypothetical protein
MMSSEAKQRIQVALVLAMVVAGLRTTYVLYQRHEDNVKAEKQKLARDAGYSNPDYYVTPKKLYPYDPKSAMQLTLQPVWVKEGYRYTYYSYDLVQKHVNFDHEAGLLLPLEKLAIKDVVTAVPSAKGRKQVMALFEKDGKGYAVPIGFEADEQYKIYSDEMFYVEDPRDLYKHWSVDVWQAIEHHEVKPGMNTLQADFAIGMGIPDSGGSYERTLRYANGGKPMVIVFRDDKAVDVKPGAPGS